MLRQTWIGALRGGLGFLGGALVFVAYLYLGSKANPDGGGSLCMSVVAFFAAGAVGGAVLAWGTDEPLVTLRVAAGFGVGAVTAVVIMIFPMISLQGGGRPEVMYLSAGAAVAFAAMGAIGGFAVSPRYALYGALSFGVPGFLMGLCIFSSLDTTATVWVAKVVGISSMLAFPVIGGAVFGAILGAHGDS